MIHRRDQDFVTLWTFYPRYFGFNLNNYTMCCFPVSNFARFVSQCKPEQVQAVHDALGEGQFRREQLLYRVGDVITVIDKT